MLRLQIRHLWLETSKPRGRVERVGILRCAQDDGS
jgi:hypothetical protein